MATLIEGGRCPYTQSFTVQGRRFDTLSEAKQWAEIFGGSIWAYEPWQAPQVVAVYSTPTKED